ncbi:MAG: DivIVA domain-containing protein [Actinomycetota bacterium]|nr:DivIVA domain-containing protein [Actinomycetota bacterium]
MPLTPADVANIAFSKPPIGKRGYHEEEVDAFLDLLETELARLVEENHDLYNRAEQLGQQRSARVATGSDLFPVERPGPVMAPALPPMTEQTSPGVDPNVQAAKVLGLAQTMVDRLTGEVQAEVDGMVGEARRKAEQLLSEAKVKADDLVNEAKSRAEIMLADARIRAETVEQQSRDKAASLEHEATRKHTEIISVLRQEKGTLEKKVEDLRAWEREYRTRLKTYLAAQLRELNGSGSGVPGAPMRNRHGFAASGVGAHAEAASR